MASVGDISSFSSPRKLVSYLGRAERLLGQDLLERIDLSVEKVDLAQAARERQPLVGRLIPENLTRCIASCDKSRMRPCRWPP